ncbi:MAG TPA: aminotransferase class IV [Candidatus Udaeobacter sp.]|jgi:branched-subunit amino acid aminotransferase/4-amino-4-deoxychorismate lyase|nr:aminotransferase class IV [Candidatus Udaeobacter sp.]
MSRAGVPSVVPERSVWIDGQLRRGIAATLSVFDRGARDGEGLFETIRVESRRPLDWERHLERLVLSAAELGFPVPASPAQLEEGLDQLLAGDGLSDAAARITVTRGIPRGRPVRACTWIEAEPLEGRLWRGTRSGGASAVISRMPFQPGPLGRHKTTSRIAYHLARDEARIARADEALLISPEGEVLEGSVSNVFLVLGGVLVTPPLSRGILPGIARAVVLELAGRLGLEAREAGIAASDFDRAEEVFLTNSIQQVVPVVKIGSRAIPGIDLGSRLKRAFRERSLEPEDRSLTGTR